ncbi:TetR/AcrR family transcriptional regulator [Pseudonocardia sp. NPDC049154]|uniref:TetR/AcrR family transcriptional regulator n=1 Tax=Pseudonocardia sp. NPDC049154 TaxID=3155501 RepID=UPI0034006928
MLSRLRPAVSHLLRTHQRFADLSVEKIISIAGIARSTFYAYFDDKGDLLRSLATDAADAVVAAVEPWTGLPDDAGRDELRAALRVLAEAYREHSATMSAMAEMAALDGEVAASYRQFMSRGGAKVEAHVRSGYAAGTIRQEIDPAITVDWLVTMLERGLYHHLRSADEENFERNVDVVTDIVWQTLYTGVPGRRRD